MSLLPAPSSAQDLLEKRRRGRRLELIDQQTLILLANSRIGDNRRNAKQGKEKKR
jgi:hypothetical protein